MNSQKPVLMCMLIPYTCVYLCILRYTCAYIQYHHTCTHMTGYHKHIKCMYNTRIYILYIQQLTVVIDININR